MRITFVAALVASTAALIITSGLSSAQTRMQAKVALTDSTAAPLSASKRVAITNVMVSFQASSGGDKTNTSGLFAAKTDASSILQMPNMDTRLLVEIADEIHAQLKSDLQASGYEVIPDAMVLASPAYQKIVQLAGITNFSKFANMNGDVMLVGASGLKPYLPYAVEVGKFGVPAKRLIKDWMTGMMAASSTPGGPTSTSTSDIYELPGLEVALAKELNAHVVKATYVVTLGTASAAVDRFSSTHRNSYTGTAFAQVGLRAEQSRIAFRTPAANVKGEAASRGYTANFGDKSAPAKDGDVVVTLMESIAGGTDFFAVDAPATKSGGLLGGLMGGFGTGADAQFTFTASITDPVAYRTEVVTIVKQAQRDMLMLVKQ